MFDANRPSKAFSYLNAAFFERGRRDVLKKITRCFGPDLKDLTLTEPEQAQIDQQIEAHLSNPAQYVELESCTVRPETWRSRRDRWMTYYGIDSEKAPELDVVAREAMRQFVEAMVIRDRIPQNVPQGAIHIPKNPLMLWQYRVNMDQPQRHMRKRYQAHKDSRLPIIDILTNHIGNATTLKFMELGLSEGVSHDLMGHLVGQSLRMAQGIVGVSWVHYSGADYWIDWQQITRAKISNDRDRVKAMRASTVNSR